MQSVLLVEDDPNISEHILSLIQSEGMTLYIVDRPEQLRDMLLGDETFSVVILDRLLGDFDTKSLMPEIRKEWPKVPIVILSAINTPIERTELINLGADDYVGKPFLGQELLARIKALSRRNSRAEETYQKLGNLVIHMLRRTISVGEKNDSLPGKEFLLLRRLIVDPGRVYSRNELLDSVWGIEADPDSNVLESTIANLRKRLEKIGATVTIKNLRNVGYWIED